MNVLQIDVEPWYADLPMDRWDDLSDRVVENTETILRLLRETDNEATFFVLAHVAEEHPELVQRIIDEGHEVGSHGYHHRQLGELTRAEFEDGLATCLDALEAAGAARIDGFRAPQFSLDQSTAWLIDVLEDEGFRYDSSVFPVKTPLYGIPNAPRYTYRIRSDDLAVEADDGLWEVPLATYPIPGTGLNLPVAGGFYLRALPYRFVRHAFRRIQDDGQPAVAYLHPWELDPSIPVVDEYDWFYYHRLTSTEWKFERLLREFDFGTTNRHLDEKRERTGH